MSYQKFIESKSFDVPASGFDCDASQMPQKIKPFQADIVKWACSLGKAAIFADTGLGKTLMQLTWADLVAKKNKKPVLILSPLCVAQQTVREGAKFGIDAEYIRYGSSEKMIHVTNYEMLKNFNPSDYCGLVLDESSILKGMMGKVRQQITDFAKLMPYRLSCTATPSPNDFMELGTQSEFLGVMSQVEMLATFFIHDGSDTSKWRLKGHGRSRFFEWVSTWAVLVKSPNDLGYKTKDYRLPDIKFHQHIVETDPEDGDLFINIAQGLQERNKARRDSVDIRCEKVKEIVKDWDCGIVWCNLNSESELIARGSEFYEITGSMKSDEKEKRILGFTDGNIKHIVTKPKIAGFGLNWQHCNKMVFVGLSDSYEAFYQAVRRCYRFGQIKPVEVHIVISDKEGAVLANIQRKQKQADRLSFEMLKIMKSKNSIFTKKNKKEVFNYEPIEKMIKPKFGAMK